MSLQTVKEAKRKVDELLTKMLKEVETISSSLKEFEKERKTDQKNTKYGTTKKNKLIETKENYKCLYDSNKNCEASYVSSKVFIASSINEDLKYEVDIIVEFVSQ